MILKLMITSAYLCTYFDIHYNNGKVENSYVDVHDFTCISIFSIIMKRSKSMSLHCMFFTLSLLLIPEVQYCFTQVDDMT